MNTPAIQQQINAPRVAWRVFVDDMRCITWSKNAAAARWNGISAAREVGYCLNRFPSLRAVRAPAYDNHELSKEPGRKVFSEEYVIYGI